MLRSRTADKGSGPFATLRSTSLWHLVNEAHQSETGEYLGCVGGRLTSVR